MSVSKLAQNLHGSEIIKIAGEINELKRQGQNIANLTIGDFDPKQFPSAASDAPPKILCDQFGQNALVD